MKKGPKPIEQIPVPRGVSSEIREDGAEGESGKHINCKAQSGKKAEPDSALFLKKVLGGA